MRTTTWMASLIAAGFLTGTASATPINLELSYSGASFGNSAIATALITIDDSNFLAPTSLSNVTSAAAQVSIFEVTVAGASAGNGTFGLADVTNWIISVAAPLDLSMDLVGQAGFNDFNWCGFGFIGCVTPAPGGVAAFTIQANAELGDLMLLTSMTQVQVPEPSTLMLLGLALAGFAGMRRIRKV